MIASVSLVIDPIMQTKPRTGSYSRYIDRHTEKEKERERERITYLLTTLTKHKGISLYFSKLSRHTSYLGIQILFFMTR